MSNISYALESTIATWVPQSMGSIISTYLAGLPFEICNFSDITDILLIPYFVLIIDGTMLSKDDPNIESLECFLSNFSGKMTKCRKCRNHADCSLDINTLLKAEGISFGSDYILPIILFNPDKRQRNIESMRAIVPPIAGTESFSPELQKWLSVEILAFHKKALRWRKENTKWVNLEILKDSRRQKTVAEVATEKWLPKNSKIELKIPKFEERNKV